MKGILISYSSLDFSRHDDNDRPLSSKPHSRPHSRVGSPTGGGNSGSPFFSLSRPNSSPADNAAKALLSTINTTNSNNVNPLNLVESLSTAEKIKMKKQMDRESDQHRILSTDPRSVNYLFARSAHYSVTSISHHLSLSSSQFNRKKDFSNSLTSSAAAADQKSSYLDYYNQQLKKLENYNQNEKLFHISLKLPVIDGNSALQQNQQSDSIKSSEKNLCLQMCFR